MELYVGFYIFAIKYISVHMKITKRKKFMTVLELENKDSFVSSLNSCLSLAFNLSSSPYTDPFLFSFLYVILLPHVYAFTYIHILLASVHMWGYIILLNVIQ